ncbi:MAG TPA: serine hydrolase domain-containing protein [Ktedonobacterales bacterium]|nr:serine hydrolase domain-containing protein [Ktedonobacterales bacterium]
MSSGGLSQSRLVHLHDVLAGSVERGDVSGLVALISRRGETHVEVLGTMAAGGSAPMRRDTIFRISSMTKPITAVATMILMEECTLRLDDPVDRLLPELADRRVLQRLDGPLDDTVPAHRPITVRDLLTFTMGFGQLLAEPDASPILQAAHDQQIGMGPPEPSGLPASDEWIRRLGTLPLMYQPGERWLYNTGSDVLGVLIARAAGQPLETFLRERIFAPLGMPDTGFSVPAARLDRLATSYWTHPGTGQVAIYDEAAGGQWSRPPAFPSGAGGLVSTADDYLAFAQMLLSLGRLANTANTRLLSRPSVELMTTDHLTPAQKAVSGLLPGSFDGLGWGFGVSVVTRRDNVAESVGTYGWSGGMGTLWSSDPREQLICILMTQRMWASPSPPAIVLDFLTSAYQAVDD